MTQGYNGSSTQIFYGLSSDTKPTGCDNGSIFIEMDTKIGYIYDADNADWTEIPNGGGSQVEMDYNEATNKPAINDVTLTGNKTPASLGLQTRISSDSMLDADLIDDANSNNKFVSATDIVNWNGKANADDVYTKTYMDTALAGKQSVIDDLSNIRSGAALGATSLQPSDVKSTYSSTGTDPVNGTAVAAAIGTLDVTAVGGSGSFISAISETNGKISATAGTVDSTPTESSTGLVTSAGIYTDQQRQETEIGAVANAGAKNLAPIETRTNKTDNKWIVGTYSGNTEPINLIAGDYIFTAVSSSTGSGQCQIKLAYSDGTTELTTAFNFGSTMTLTFTASKDVVGYGIYSNPAPVTFEKMMIRPATITDATYQPYALSNPVLTPAAIKAVDEGAKNVLNSIATTGSSGSLSWTVASDGTITVNGTNDTRSRVDIHLFGIGYLPNIYSGMLLSGCKNGSSSGQNRYYILALYSNDGIVWESEKAQYDAPIIIKDSPYCRISIMVPKDSTLNNVVFKPMICTKAEWDVSHKYVPYALSNPVITPALVELVDSGAKNHCTLASGSNTPPGRWIDIPVSDVGVGQWVMSFGTLISTDTDDTFCQAICYNSSDQIVSNWVNFKREPNTNKIFTMTDEVSYVRLYPANSYATSDGDTVTFTDAMICTKAAWDVSHAYQPYRPSWQEIYENYATPIPKNADLDDYTVRGTYCVANSTDAATILHAPASNYGFILEVFSISNNTKYQRMTIGSDIYTRRKQSSGWQSWYKFAGTEVT